MASILRVADSGFDSRLRRGDFSVLSHTNDLKTGPPVAALPGAWRYRVSAGIDGPVSVYCDWVSRKFDLQLMSLCGST